jgi:hypothetical protein
LNAACNTVLMSVIEYTLMSGLTIKFS